MVPVHRFKNTYFKTIKHQIEKKRRKLIVNTAEDRGDVMERFLTFPQNRRETPMAAYSGSIPNL